MTDTGFRPASPHAMVVRILLGLNVVADVALIWVSAAEIALLRRVERGQLVTPSELDASDARSAAVGALAIVLLIVTGIAWIVWQRRSQINVHARGVPGLRFTPGWVVGWWLIPLANFVMPYQTVRELWAASAAEDGWVRAPTWPVLGWWWAAWVTTNVTGRIAFGLVGEEPSVDDLIAADGWSIVSSVTSIVAAFLATLIVRSVDRRQARLVAPPTFTAPSLPPPPPPPVP